jgi:hypothetical protein
MTMRHLLALLLVSGTAHAGEHELSIGSTTQTLRTSSANALTGDSLGGGRLAYGRGLDLEVIDGLALWGEAGFAWGDATGTMFQTLDTELDTLGLSVGARARYALHPRVIASARLDIGMTRAAVAIRDRAGRSASDAGWGPSSTATLGVDLLAIRRPRFALGLRTELGVVGAAPIALTAQPEVPDDDTLRLQMSAASLGSLNLSGTTFALSVVSEF